MARGFCPHTFFNYQTVRGERQNKTDSSNAWLPPLFASYSLQVTRSSYSVERAMEVLLQDRTGAPRAHATNCTETFFSLFDYKTARGTATNQPDDDDGCCCCFF